MEGDPVLYSINSSVNKLDPPGVRTFGGRMRDDSKTEIHGGTFSRISKRLLLVSSAIFEQVIVTIDQKVHECFQVSDSTTSPLPSPPLLSRYDFYIAPKVSIYRRSLFRYLGLSRRVEYCRVPTRCYHAVRLPSSHVNMGIDCLP